MELNSFACLLSLSAYKSGYSTPNFFLAAPTFAKTIEFNINIFHIFHQNETVAYP